MRETEQTPGAFQKREGARRNTRAPYNTLGSLGLSDRGESEDPETPEEHAAGMKNGAALLEMIRKMDGDY